MRLPVYRLVQPQDSTTQCTMAQSLYNTAQCRAAQTSTTCYTHFSSTQCQTTQLNTTQPRMSQFSMVQIQHTQFNSPSITQPNNTIEPIAIQQDPAQRYNSPEQPSQHKSPHMAQLNSVQLNPINTAQYNTVKNKNKNNLAHLYSSAQPDTPWPKPI